MSNVLKTLASRTDRPGWIPTHITQNWDPSPYAYQTEEELMPAGGLHGQWLAYLMELLRVPLKAQGLMLLMDTFLLYRDAQGIKQRVAPDLLLMPFMDPPPSAYDLDRQPPPSCIIEVTSPKSHFRDVVEKVDFYHGLGTATYLVIDAITPRDELRQPIALHLWRVQAGEFRKIPTDSGDWLILPEMNIRVQAEGRHLRLWDLNRNQLLQNNEELLQDNQALVQDNQALVQDNQALVQDNQALVQDNQALAQDNQALVQDNQALALRAEAESKRAEQAQRRVDQQAQRAEALAAKLKALGIDPESLVE